MRTSACSSCGAPVVWVAMATGRSAPLNADPVPNGNVELDPAGGARVLGKVDAEARRLAGVELYLSHFATCPNAARHRRGK